MIWYRIAREEHISDDADFVSGHWSAKRPGRWNMRGQAVVYTAENADAAVAECGRYWVLRKAEEFNLAFKTKGKPPEGWLEELDKIMDIRAYIAEVETPESLRCLDIRQQIQANQKFTEFDLADLTFDISQQDSHLIIPDHLTKKFGSQCELKGFQQMLVKSARSNDACSVFFKKNCSISDLLVKKKNPIRLFGIFDDHSRLERTLKRASERALLYELDHIIKMIFPEMR